MRQSAKYAAITYLRFSDMPSCSSSMKDIFQLRQLELSDDKDFEL